MRRAKWFVAFSLLWSSWSMAAEPINVEFRGDRVSVTGSTEAVQEIGLSYLVRLNPKILETPEGREEVAKCVRSAQDGTVVLSFQRGPWRCAALAVLKNR